MHVFDYIAETLTCDAFTDTDAVKKVSKADYELFLKEVVFDKLAGKRLGQAFCERFGIRDRVLSIYTLDGNAIEHIEHCKYVK
jgi:hypothetical protein